MRPCQGRDRGFESRRDRHEIAQILGDFSLAYQDEFIQYQQREKVPLLLLLSAILLSMLTINTGRLGLSMVMAVQDFTPHTKRMPIQIYFIILVGVFPTF